MSMQTALSPSEVRERLRALIEARHGTVSRRVVGRVARDASIEASTLARYFGFYPGKAQTLRLQEGTLRSVLLALGADPFDFLRLVTDRQLDLWPAPLHWDSGGALVRSDGTDQLRAFAEAMRDFPLALRLRLAQAAILAGIGSIADAGEAIPEDVYVLLRQLDESKRELRQLRLVAV